MKQFYLVFCFVFLRTYVGKLFLLQFNVINSVFLRTYVGILLFKDICLIFFFQIFYCSPLVLKGYLQLSVCFFNNSFLGDDLSLFVVLSNGQYSCFKFLHQRFCTVYSTVLFSALYCAVYCTALVQLFVYCIALFVYALYKLLHQWFYLLHCGFIKALCCTLRH